jgi:hypothetical protein
VDSDTRGNLEPEILNKTISGCGGSDQHRFVLAETMLMRMSFTIKSAFHQARGYDNNTDMALLGLRGRFCRVT